MSAWRRTRRAAVEATVLEERQRIARELHDGVVQQVVALVYRIDDAAFLAGPGPARQAVDALRDDVARLACEVRDAVEDLRGGAPSDGLAAALSSYAGELAGHGDVRVHVHLDERGERPAARVEREVLKIAREAIANALQHAHAVNLWVRFVADGHRLVLVVEDDGVGTVAPRPGHFGLQGMQERAERIGADLTIRVRQDGGTTVTLSTRVPASPRREGVRDESQRLAHR